MNVKSKYMVISIQRSIEGISSCSQGMDINTDCMQVPAVCMIGLNTCCDSLHITKVELHTSMEGWNVYKFINK